eukprot:1355610-Amorphochlora_amoeboformis.AAC.1
MADHMAATLKKSRSGLEIPKPTKLKLSRRKSVLGPLPSNKSRNRIKQPSKVRRKSICVSSYRSQPKKDLQKEARPPTKRVSYSEAIKENATLKNEIQIVREAAAAASKQASALTQKVSDQKALIDQLSAQRDIDSRRIALLEQGLTVNGINALSLEKFEAQEEKIERLSGTNSMIVEQVKACKENLEEHSRGLEALLLQLQMGSAVTTETQEFHHEKGKEEEKQPQVSPEEASKESEASIIIEKACGGEEIH